MLDNQILCRIKILTILNIYIIPVISHAHFFPQRVSRKSVSNPPRTTTRPATQPARRNNPFWSTTLDMQQPVPDTIPCLLPQDILGEHRRNSLNSRKGRKRRGCLQITTVSSPPRPQTSERQRERARRTVRAGK